MPGKVYENTMKAQGVIRKGKACEFDISLKDEKHEWALQMYKITTYKVKERTMVDLGILSLCTSF